jgi:hypothetical protein
MIDRTKTEKACKYECAYKDHHGISPDSGNGVGEIEEG